MQGISANRMTLLKLRKRLARARRGHKLLKHKLDELMHIYQEEIEKALEAYETLGSSLKEVYVLFLLGKGLLREETLYSFLSAPSLRVTADTGTEHLLNIKVPRVTARVDVSSPPYGLIGTNSDLNSCVQTLPETVKEMVEFAQLQKKLELIVAEIERTRRRVNALEYILFPQMEGQVRFIQMKLEEAERADATRLMRVKSTIRGDR
jgi:V/A-type H+-transporting ATPase subunit D